MDCKWRNTQYGKDFCGINYRKCDYCEYEIDFDKINDSNLEKLNDGVRMLILYHGYDDLKSLLKLKVREGDGQMS